ncbi:MAG: DUF1801 domain-containing protein [Calditrichaeota bacterium]|nr:DUF1801 domain-containing protein [Calditrichota bacterium]
MKLHTDPAVPDVFANYPDFVQKQMQHLRQLVIDVANDLKLTDLQETLKWGEPSYLAKHGSTLRMDWKEKKADQYAVYFKCTSKLVPTFKAIYPDTFQFEGDRAIVFKLNEQIPESELKQCIAMALTYHKIKHLPLLGA